VNVVWPVTNEENIGDIIYNGDKYTNYELSVLLQRVANKLAN
jgi:hypothetical protein